MSNINAFHSKNLNDLPLPIAFQPLDYEQELQNRINLLNGFQPLMFDENYQPIFKQVDIEEDEKGLYFRVPVSEDAGTLYLGLETEPLLKLAQVDAYLALLDQNNKNHYVLSVMPNFATESSLDNLARRDGIYRHIIKEEDTSVNPPLPAVLEDDESFRRRWFLSKEALSAGGSEGWYLYHALSADPLVKDAFAYSPTPRGVEIIILSYEGNGTASVELLETVRTHINRQISTLVMTDELVIKSAEVIEYSITATITYYNGASNDLVKQQIESAYLEFKLKTERIAHGVKDTAFLNQAGVYSVAIEEVLPTNINNHQAVFCTELELLDGGDYEYV